MDECTKEVQDKEPQCMVFFKWCGFSKWEYKSVGRQLWTLQRGNEENEFKINRTKTKSLELRFQNEVGENRNDWENESE